MAIDVKAVSIKVSAQGIKKAANDLAELSKAAKTFDLQSATAFKQLEEFSRLSFQGVSQSLRDSRDSIQAFKTITSKDAGKALANSVEKISTSFDKLKNQRGDIDAFIAQIDRLKTGMQELSANGAVRISLGSGGGRSGSSGAASDDEKFAKSQQRLLKQVEYQAVAFEKGKAGLLEYRAAQMGVAEQAAPFIARMRGMGETVAYGANSTRALNNAMRQVPAQFTDIATQLAGGQNPLLILLQQGGQLADVFRMVGVSVGNMLKILGGMVLKFLLNPVVLAAGAVAGLAYSFYKASAGVSEFGKSLALTNGYIGITKKEFTDMAYSIGGTTGNIGRAEEALNAFAATGKFTTRNLGEMVAATVEFANVSGKKVQDVVAEYASLRDGPAKALAKLNEQYHFLTAAQLDNVRSLERNGEATKALETAQNLLSSAHQNMAKNALENMGKMERGWYNLKEGVKSYWDAVTGVTRSEDTERKQLANASVNVIRAIENKEKALKLAAQTGRTIGEAEMSRYDGEILRWRQIQEAIVDTQKARTQRQAAESGAKEEEQRLISAREYADTVSKELRVKDQVMKIDKQIAAIRSAPQKSDYDDARIIGLEQEKIRLLDSLKEKTTTASVSRLSQLQAEEKALRADIQLVQTAGSEYSRLTDRNKELYAVQIQMRSTQDGKELAKLQALANQLQINVGLEKERAGFEAIAKEVVKWEELTAATVAQNTALDQHIQYLRESGQETDRRSEAEKKLAQAQYTAANATDAQVRAAASATAQEMQYRVEKERTAKAVASANKLTAENTQYQLQQDKALQSLIEKHNQENMSLGISNRELEKRTALNAIRVQQDYEVAMVQAQINTLQKDSTTNHEAEIAALEKKINLINGSAAARANEIKGLSDYKALDSGSVLNDMEAGWKNFYNGLQTRQDEFASFYSSSVGLMQDTLGNFFTTGKAGFKDFAKSMLEMIAKMIARLLVLKAVQTVVGMFGGGGAASSGAVGLNTTGATTMMAAKGASFSNGVAKFAKGGTFTNSIVNQPTPFMFASGGAFKRGLMGEAGAEAILPLSRGPDGSLGVRNNGGGGGDTNVHISVVVQQDGSAQTSVQGSSEQDARQLGNMIKQSVIGVIQEQKRPGGLLQSVA